MELLSSDRLSKAITLKTQVLPVPDLAWEIRSKTQHLQSHDLTQLVLCSTTFSISSSSINQVTHLKYVIQSITATLKLIYVFGTVITFLPNTKVDETNMYPELPDYPVLILYMYTVYVNHWRTISVPSFQCRIISCPCMPGYDRKCNNNECYPSVF